MNKNFHGISPKFMHNLVEEFDSKYHTRSCYVVGLDENGNVKSLNKKLNYRPPKSNKFIWTRIISMARTKNLGIGS